MLSHSSKRGGSEGYSNHHNHLSNIPDVAFNDLISFFFLKDHATHFDCNACVILDHNTPHTLFSLLKNLFVTEKGNAIPQSTTYQKISQVPCLNTQVDIAATVSARVPVLVWVPKRSLLYK
jgi:hypothetical protein